MKIRTPITEKIIDINESISHYTLMHNLKVFQFKDGFTYWVMAPTFESAVDFLIKYCKENNYRFEYYESKELHLSELKHLSYQDECYSGSMLQQYYRCLITEHKFPCILALRITKEVPF